LALVCKSACRQVPCINIVRWRNAKSVIWRALGAAVLTAAASITVASWPAAASSSRAPAPDQTILGAYIGAPGDSSSPWEDRLRTFESAMGQSPAIVLQYTDFSYTDWKDLGRLASGTLVPDMKRSSKLKGMVPMIGLFMATNTTNAATSYARLAAGYYDRYLIEFIDAYKMGGFTQIYLRPGWEMNGTWFPWRTNTPQLQSAFVRAWRRLYTVVKSVPDIKVTVIWNPAAATQNWINLYPGDSYVDMIGIDTGGYNFAKVDSNQPLDTQTYSVATAAQMCLAHSKPLSFPEIYDVAVLKNGSINTTDTQLFLKNVIQALKNNAGVYVHDVEIWNDTSGSNNGNSKWADHPALVPIWKSFWQGVQTLPPP
jgi:hypothetical protein